MKDARDTIGIVGGGQLGRMLTQAAHNLGFRVIVLDPTPGSPAGLIADEEMTGSFKDKEKILEIGEKCDFMTFEIESANAEALEELLKRGKIVSPNPRILKIIKDKFAQKVFLKNHGIPVGDFALVANEKDAESQGEIFGYPYLLKARFDAYDGRGNYLVKNKGDIKQAFKKLSSGPVYAEEFVPFFMELSGVSWRDSLGSIESFPMVETVHKNNICHIVRSPAVIPEDIKEKGEEIVKKILEGFK